MRFAFVTNSPPTPVITGARIRNDRLSRALARDHKVVWYCPSFDAPPGTSPNLIDADIVREIRAPSPPWPTSSQGIAQWEESQQSLDPRGHLLAADHERAPFDAIICEQLQTIHVWRSISNVPLILDEHNIESDASSAVLRARGLPVEGSALIRTIDEYQRHWWPAARLVTCVSSAERERIAKVRSGPTIHIPNGVTVSHVPFRLPSNRAGSAILFIASYSWAPNVYAAEILAREILPKVQSRVPDASLVLCGKNDRGNISHLSSDRVLVTNIVESVLPFLDGAAVYANPLREGAGSSLKAVEALSSGIPVVSTSVGMRGFEARAGEHYLPAESSEEMSEAIAHVLTSRSSFDALAVRSRKHAARFDWEGIATKFTTAVENVLHAGSLS